MNEVLKPSLYDILMLLRSGGLPFQEFQTWLRIASPEVTATVSPGVLLRLKNGDFERVMSAVAKVLPACEVCECISPEGGFSDLSQYQCCSKIVDSKLAAGKFLLIQRPHWIKSEINQYGADGYYKCVSCEACWMLVEPEKGRYGLWQRIS